MKGLAQLKVIVCAGTGGVGKTTVAASLGELFARRGRRVLVLTLDPARRLAAALGLEGSAFEEQKVPLAGAAGELWTAMIEPARIFDRFVRRVSPSAGHAERLIRNPLYQELSRSLNGSQEFTSLERLLEAEEAGKYDLVILDTPPTQHAVDFLRAPEQIFSLFQDSITRWFIADPDPTAPGSLLKALFHRGTKTVLNALERITGSQFIGELSDFFQSMSALQKVVAERSMRVHRLLSRESTGFLLVTGFDEAKLKEARVFIRELKRGGYHLAGVVINRSFPDWFGDGDGQSENRAQLPAEVRDLYSKLKTFYAERIQLCDQFSAELSALAPVVRIPDFRRPVTGLDGLHQMSLKLESTALVGDEK